MPIDLYLPSGILRGHDRQPRLAQGLTEALLRWTDAANDDFLRSNVAVFVHELARSCVFAGGRQASVVRVDVKVPPVALTTQERRSGFTSDATALVRAAASVPLEHVWVFISHATEGGWGIDGRALTSEDLS